MGALANNEGGVVVFGIQADKDPITKIDAANAIAFVPDVSMLATKLTELSRFSTDPPVVGIRIEPICPADSTEGFVVCHIPEGTAKPHQSQRAERSYYMRIGDEAKEIPRSGVSVCLLCPR